MEARKLFASIVRMVMVVMVVVFAVSCTKDDLDEFQVTSNGGPENPTNFDINGSDINHNLAYVSELDFGSAVDTMSSWVKGNRFGEDFRFEKEPLFSAEVNIEGDVQKIDSYDLDVTGFTCTQQGKPQTANIDGFYNRRDRWAGQFFVNGGRKATIDASTMNFSKFWTATEASLDLPGADIDSIAFGGVVIRNIGEEVVVDNIKYKRVTFGLILKTYRSSRGAKVVATKSTRTSSDLVANVEANIEYLVKDGAIVPTEDVYVSYGNVRKFYTYNWNRGVVEFKALVDEYWSISGTKTVELKKDFPFNYNISGSQSFNSTSKTVNHTSDANDITSNGTELMTNCTLKTTYGYSLVDANSTKVATFNWSKGGIEYRGDIITADIEAPTQSFGGISQVSENTSGNITTTKHALKNNISFGGDFKNNSSEIVVNVDNTPAEVKLTSVTVKEKGNVIEGNNEKSWIIFTETYSDGSKKENKVTEYFPFSATPASDVTKIQNAFGLTYVNSNSNTTNSVANSGNVVKTTHTLTTTHVVKLNDGTTVSLAFVGKYGSGKVTVYKGTEFERTEDFQTSVMTQNFVNISEGSAIASGEYKRTPYTVNNKVVFSTKNIDNSAKVNVDVKESTNSEKGRLIKVTVTRSNKVGRLHLIHLKEWEKGFEVVVDGVEQGRFWKKSEFHSSVLGNLRSATAAGPNGTWMPSTLTVFDQTQNGYWSWLSKDASGKDYKTTYAYFANNLDKNYCFVNATNEFVGDYLIVKVNGTEVARYSVLN